MKKNICLIAMAVLVIVSSLTFVTGAFANDQVDVQVGQDINVNTTVLSGSTGSTKDKYLGSAYMPAFEGFFVSTPNVPVKGDFWSLKESGRVFLALPDVITDKMIPTYFSNKLKLVDDEHEKKKLAKGFAKARKTLMRTANVVVVYDLPATKAIRPYVRYPDARAIKGKDYLAMGSITFQTREEFKKWYNSLKLENISSDDLGMMISEAGMKLGANFFVPTGEGAELLFGTQAKGLDIGALLAGGLSVAGENALPMGGSIGSALSGTSGSNRLKGSPFLSAALVRVVDFKKTFHALSAVEKKQAIAEVKTLKKDKYLTLAMCAKPVQTPNGVTRLQVAEEELARYIASGNNDLEALSVFQSHMAQGIRDNIKGENLKIAQKGIVLAWIERSHVIKRAFEAQLINKAEFTKAHADNISQAIKAMEKYQLATVPDIGVYAPMLKMHNSTYSAVK